MRVRLSSLCLVLFALPAFALQLVQPGVQGTITEFGRYQIDGAPQRQLAAESTAGYSSIVDAALLEAGSQIPLRIGEAFGFRFAISDTEHRAEWLPVEIHISHPPLADHRGRSRNGFIMRSAARRGADGQFHNAAYYILREPRELAPGEWRIDVVYRGQRVLGRSFQLTAPAGDESRLAGHSSPER